MRTFHSTMLVALFLAGLSGNARADGAEMYRTRCASCHGKDGTADTTMGRKLNMRDLTDPKVQTGSSDKQWTRIIVDGVRGAGGKNVMPATKGTAEEVKDVIKFIRTFKKK